VEGFGEDLEGFGTDGLEVLEGWKDLWRDDLRWADGLHSSSSSGRNSVLVRFLLFLLRMNSWSDPFLFWAPLHFWDPWRCFLFSEQSLCGLNSLFQLLSTTSSNSSSSLSFPYSSSLDEEEAVR
jgi:hypothetical protein